MVRVKSLKEGLVLLKVKKLKKKIKKQNQKKNQTKTTKNIKRNKQNKTKKKQNKVVCVVSKIFLKNSEFKITFRKNDKYT